MINFRYHVISLIAVFLALSIGIIMGTTVISEGIVSQLRRDARDFSNRSKELRRDKDALESRVAFDDRFGAAVLPVMVQRRLAGKSVVLLIQDGAPAPIVERLNEALRLAGIAKPARLRMTSAWSLTGEADRDRLALATGGSAGDSQALTLRAAESLGLRLVRSGDTRRTGDLLKVMADAGFLRMDDIPPAAFPAPGAVVILVAAGIKDSVPAQDGFFVPLLRSMAGRRGTAVTEPYGAGQSLAELVRGDAALKESIATVDHADTAPGQISIVWAVQMLGDGREAGHFGVLGGASGVIPDVKP